MDTSMLGESAMADATMQDAGIMDHMEDLFGKAADGLDVDVPVPGPPPPPGLVARLTEMHMSGACTKLAWSNTGSIAHISPDGRKITFRLLLRDFRSGKWSLSEESRYPLSAPDGATFVHLQFNIIGQELVAVDDVGCVYVYSISGALGRMQLQSKPVDGEARARRSNLDAVIGLHWLPMHPIDCRHLYIGPVQKQAGIWSTHTSQRNANGVKTFHPVDNSRSFIHVTRSNVLTLFYQQDGWQNITKQLSSPTSTRDLLSHAAFAEHNGSLLLVTHDVCKRLRIYTVTIQWNISEARTGSQTLKRIAPTLEIDRLTALNKVGSQQSDSTQLSHLGIVPPTPENVDHGVNESTTIFAVYTPVEGAGDATQQHQGSLSVISRWHVESLAQNLHDSFSKVKANGHTSRNLSSMTVLRRQPDVVSSKLILSLESHYFETMLGCVASDGTIEFRDRSTLNIIEPYGDTTLISSLSQSGFEHAPSEHNLDLAASPDGSAVAYVRQDGKVDAKLMSLRYGWMPLEDGINDTKGILEAAVVALMRQYIFLTCSNTSHEEILGLLPSDLNEELRHILGKEVLRLAHIGPDVSHMEEQKRQSFVMRDMLITRGLSITLALGMKQNSPKERTLPGQLAWAVLNVKHVCMSITSSVARNDLPSQDVLLSLKGNSKWAMDFMTYIFESLIAMKLSAKPGDSARQVVEAYTAATDNPTVQLLLCSFPRTFLRILSMYLPRYLKTVQASVQRARSVLERQQLIEIVKMEQAMPFKLEIFMALLNAVEAAMREVHREIGTMQDRRRGVEIDMLVEGSVPPSIDPALNTLVNAILPKIAEEVDMTKLYFPDSSWLGMSVLAPAEGTVTYDVLRKTPLPPSAKLRLCRRCGSATEDITPEALPKLPPWMQQANRHCVCTSAWYLP